MKQRRWQFMAVAPGFVALIFRGAPPARSSAAIAGAPTTTAEQVPYDATAGGSASITGFQMPGLILTAQGSGIGKVAISGANASVLNATVVVRADIDVTQNPVLIKNGTLSITAPTGEEIQGVFEGQGSAPDAAGFIDVNANFQITSGKGRYNGGGGTVTGVVNFLRSSFSIGVKGNLVPAQAQQ